MIHTEHSRNIPNTRDFARNNQTFLSLMCFKILLNSLVGHAFVFAP